MTVRWGDDEIDTKGGGPRKNAKTLGEIDGV